MESKANRCKRVPRTDGTETRKQIIECAGKLIAQKGFVATTSKEICQELGINLAAINYHFGSRDGLYVEILSNVHDHLLSLDFLEELASEQLTLQQRVEQLIGFIIHKACIEEDWQLQLWLREIVSGNPLLDKVIEKTVLPKLKLVLTIFGAYFELALDDMRLHSLIQCLLAPVFSFIIARQHNVQRLLPATYDLQHFVELMQANILINLQAQRAALAAKH
ncbi:MAG: TetR/AcrR family transcriptional regulator [Phascolarctobacterium sp.]|nr:TetR/AcrR family transcriptional regulator [Phascolarctobacterium sp.]